MSPARIGSLQVASGLLNAWCVAAVAWAMCGNVCGGLTESFGNLGGLWGWLACGLVPFGWIEVFVGLQTRRTGDVRWSRRLAVLEVLTILWGALPSAIVGLTVLRAGGWPSPASPGRTGPQHPDPAP